MISLQQLEAATDLNFEEIRILDPFSSLKHDALLASYLQNLWRGPEVIREMIVANIRSSLELGALQRASDHLLVLRIFLTDHPEAQIAACPCEESCATLTFDRSSSRFSTHCPNVRVPRKATH